MDISGPHPENGPSLRHSKIYPKTLPNNPPYIDGSLLADRTIADPWPFLYGYTEFISIYPNFFKYGIRLGDNRSKKIAEPFLTT